MERFRRGACSPGETLDTRALLPRFRALSPDGTTLAVCGTRGAPQLWDVATAVLVSEVVGVEFSPYVVACGPDGTLYIGSGVPETFQESDPERARRCTVGTGGHVTTGPDPHGIGVHDIAVHPEGARIALRELLGADPSPRIVVGTIGARMPGLLLSPQAHGLLARAHQALGEETDASRERKLSILSLREIADSGTGTVAADGNAEDLLPILVGIPPCAASGESGRSAIARGLRLTSSAPSSTRM